MFSQEREDTIKKRTKAEFQKALQEMVGKKIGKLTVLAIQEKKSFKEHTSCLCLCDCGKEKSFRFHWLEQGELVSCGCWKSGPERMNPAFLRKFEKTDGCWEWKGYINKQGYGRHLGKYAHRLSFIYHHGEIPADKIICHKCDNKKCVNPDHLYAGTHKTNTEDAVNFGSYKGWSRKKK